MKTRLFVRPARKSASIIEPLECRITPGSISFPTVASIDRETPVGPDTGASSVTFKVTFNTDRPTMLTGVDATDFKVVTTGDAKADAAVVVTGTIDPKVYNVTVNGVQGNGGLGLNLVDNNSITDGTENSLGGFGLNDGSFTGEVYHVLQTAPKVNSIVATPPTTTSNSTLTWTVTFSESVTGVDAGDFTLIPTGSTTSNAPTLSGSGSVYTLTATGVAGTGTIGANLVDDGSIKDSDKNPLQTSPVAFSTVATTASGSAFLAVATGDINGDGRADIVAADYNANNVAVLLGNSAGGFTPQASVVTGSRPTSIALADVNGDGRPDIVVTDSLYSSGTFHSVGVLLGNGDGTFQAEQGYGFSNQHLAIAVSDIDGDGRPDIVQTSQSGTGQVNVLRGNGNGSFQNPISPAVGQRPVGVALADVNGDGRPDVVTANYGSNNVSVLINTSTPGSISFASSTAFGTGLAPASVALGDVNGDGKLDIVTGNNSDGTVSVLIGVGDGSFLPKTDSNTGTSPGSTRPSGVALTDVNGDGKLDIVAASGVFSGTQGIPSELAALTAQVSVLVNTGSGIFAAPQLFNTNTANGLAVAIADFNGDGKADITVVGASSGTPPTALPESGPELAAISGARSMPC